MITGGPRPTVVDTLVEGYEFVLVTVAHPTDLAGYLALAAQVEHWFGPMVNDTGFRHVLEKNIGRGTAMCVHRPDATGLRGGILFSIRPSICRINWLVVAQADRGAGVGATLVTEAIRQLDGPGVVEVVTFSHDHPAAMPSGARAFYERLGFTAREPADPAPDGTPRQWYRKHHTP
jgi:GNAT superfamily N-acetyltransferase